MQQKVAMARCVLKQPDLLILHQSFSALDGGERTQILKALREEFKGRGLIFSLRFPSMAEEFDHIVVMRRGELVEKGNFEELTNKGGYFSELLDIEKSQM
jgi:ABC-type multidrug transport system fused ATPase/permease subunit